MKLSIYKVSDARTRNLVHHVAHTPRKGDIVACTFDDKSMHIRAPQPAFPYVSKYTAVTCWLCLAFAEKFR